MRKLSAYTIAIVTCFIANTSYALTPLISWSLKDASYAVFSASNIPHSTDVKVTESVPEPTYSTIVNKYKMDTGRQNSCLRAQDNNSAKMGSCNEQGSDYTSMRQWQFIKTNADYYLIKNQYSDDADSNNRCLRVFANRNSAEMGACVGQGGASDYNSMRYWSVVDVGTGYILLINKFRTDAGSNNRCLRVFASGESVEMGACVGQGGSSDYYSMRYWKYDGALN